MIALQIPKAENRIGYWRYQIVVRLGTCLALFYQASWLLVAPGDLRTRISTSDGHTKGLYAKSYIVKFSFTNNTSGREQKVQIRGLQIRSMMT